MKELNCLRNKLSFFKRIYPFCFYQYKIWMILKDCVNISPTINIAAMIITYSTKPVFFKTPSWILLCILEMYSWKYLLPLGVYCYYIVAFLLYLGTDGGAILFILYVPSNLVSQWTFVCSGTGCVFLFKLQSKYLWGFFYRIICTSSI